MYPEACGLPPIQIFDQVYPNHSRLVRIEMPTRQPTLLACLYHSGQVHDPIDSEAGLPHIHEHDVIIRARGSANVNTYQKSLDKIAIETLAETGNISTWFYLLAYPNVIVPATRALIEMIGRPRVDFSDHKIEKKIIAAEELEGKDEHVAMAVEILSELMYAGSPAGKAVIGTEKGRRRVTPESIRRYQRLVHVGSNIDFLSVGQSRHGIRKIFEETIATLPTGSRLIAPPNYYGSEKRRVVECPVVNAYYALAVPALPLSDERRVALRVLQGVLGGERFNKYASPLHAANRRAGWMYEYINIVDSQKDVGYAGVAGAVRPEYLEKLMAIFTKVLVNLADNIKPADLLRAQREAAGRIPKVLQSPMSLGEFIATQLLETDSYMTPIERIRSIYRVRLAEIKDLAAELFTKSAFRLAVLGPTDSELKPLKK